MTESLVCNYQLRAYQHQWVKDILLSWSRGNRRVLAQLATGGGKTICFAHISHKFFKRDKQVLVIAHRFELIAQAAEKLEQIVSEPVGIIKSGIPSHPERKLQVASIQSLARRELHTLPPNIGLLIFDEAHHASASSYRRVIEHYKHSAILGVTATPQRIDGQGFIELFDDLVIGTPTANLIHQGHLSKFRLFATGQTLSTKGVDRSRGDYRAKDLALAVASQIGVSQIFQNYLKYALSMRTVIFACSLEHSKAVALEFCRQGVKTEHLDGDTKPAERVRILERFKSGITMVITNYEILTEGYDCPDIECVYCVRPTESVTLWIQMVGRCLRSNGKKSTAVIIDVTDNWRKHGLPDERRQWSLSPTAPTTTHSKGLIKCPDCTHIFKPLSHELVILYGEITESGLVVAHHEAICPGCGKLVHFTTKESNHRPSRIPVKHNLNLDLSEINLEVSQQKQKQVYKLITKEGLQKTYPSKVYKTIFMNFIETITEFTLGDWREIVKLAEPLEVVTTKKAWELYQEALLRHKNRIAALGFMEKRKSLNQSDEPVKKDFTEQRENSAQRQLKSPPLTPQIGNPYFQQKYAKQWEESLASCSVSTADFLGKNAGLFHVEVKDKFINISIEIANLDNLKERLKDIKDAEFQSAFSQGFGKTANVMLRISKS